MNIIKRVNSSLSFFKWNTSIKKLIYDIESFAELAYQ